MDCCKKLCVYTMWLANLTSCIPIDNSLLQKLQKIVVVDNLNKN